MKTIKSILRRWHRRVLLLMLGVTLALIVSLAYKIVEKQSLTNQQNLLIGANAWLSVTSESLSILAAMVQQDYHTFTTYQETLGQELDLTTLMVASNNSYQSRIMNSIASLREKLLAGKHMIGAIYLGEDGEDLSDWYREFPYTDSITSLAKDIHRQQLQRFPLPQEEDANLWDETSTDEPLNQLLSTYLEDKKPSDTTDPKEIPTTLRLVKLFNQPALLLFIPLEDRGSVVCILDPSRVFARTDLNIIARDGENSFAHTPQNKTKFTYHDTLYGLPLTFSNKHHIDTFLIFIVPSALLILILILYQSHVALLESQTNELTGLPNMRTFEKYFQNALKRPGVTFLFFLDLRSLKMLNTVFMEEQADEIIKAFAKTLRSTLGRNDPIIHRSGDEIIIILTLVDVALLENVLHRLRKAFALKTVRLQVRQNTDRSGAPIKLYGKHLGVGSFLDMPISFRIGGMAVNIEAQQKPRKILLDEVNLLAEEAKRLENPDEPGVVWLIKYQESEGRQTVIEGRQEEIKGPRLVEIDMRSRKAR